MRTIAINFVLMLCAPLACLSQHLVPALTVEKNVAGCEYGTSLAYQSRNLISFGAFYQTSLPLKTEGMKAKKNFTGAVLNIPIAKSQNINFYFQSRIGLADERFLVFAAGVDTEIHLVRNVWIHAVAGLRMTYPSLTTKISFKL